MSSYIFTIALADQNDPLSMVIEIGMEIEWFLDVCLKVTYVYI